jgi:hypothetical protein
MNTKTLARHYDTLTPQERFPLILAAAARGDDLERERLVSSAPRATYRVPDYWSVATRFQSLSHFMFMKLLDLAACYLEAFALSGEEDEGGIALEAVLMLGYVFQTYRGGWHLFSAEVGVDPEHHWKRLPGLETIRSAEELSGTGPGQVFPGVAFVQEEAARYLARTVGGGSDAEVDEEQVKMLRVLTAAEVAASLRVLWQEYLEQWG